METSLLLYDTFQFHMLPISKTARVMMELCCSHFLGKEAVVTVPGKRMQLLTSAISSDFARIYDTGGLRKASS